MIGGAAGDDDDPLDAGQQPVVKRAEVAEVDAVLAHRPVGDRLRDRVGLLVDLLERERLEAALLGLGGVPLDRLDGPVADRLAGRGDKEVDAVGAHGDDLAVLDQLDVARMGEEGGDGGADELLAVTSTDHERALLAGRHEQVGIVDADRDEGVVPAEAVVGGPDGLDEVLAALKLSARETRWAMTSASVSEVNTAPSATRPCLSSR